MVPGRHHLDSMFTFHHSYRQALRIRLYLRPRSLMASQAYVMTHRPRVYYETTASRCRAHPVSQLFQICFRLFSTCVRHIAQALRPVIAWRTLQIERCLQTINAVSIRGLCIESNAPLSLHTVIGLLILACRVFQTCTYRSNKDVCKPDCIIDEYGPFGGRARQLGLVRIWRLTHLLKIIANVESAIERAKVASVGCGVDLIVNSGVDRYVLCEVSWNSD